MTVIAAITDGRTVWIGSDSLATSGDVRIPHGPKLVRKRVGRTGGDLVIGTSGTSALGPLVRYDLDVPVPPDPEDDDDVDSWAHAVAKAITELAVEATPPMTYEDDDATRHLDGGLILGYAGRLYIIETNLALRVAGYTATGSAREPALGALSALTALEIHRLAVKPERALDLAIRAAIAHHAGAGGDVHVERVAFPGADEE